MFELFGSDFSFRLTAIIILILSILPYILFLGMAANVSQMKKQLDQTNRMLLEILHNTEIARQETKYNENGNTHTDSIYWLKPSTDR